MNRKNWKKNLVAAGVLVTVCAGIYMNWVYSGGEAKTLTDTLDAQKVMSDELLVLDGTTVEVGSDDVDTVTDYFFRGSFVPSAGKGQCCNTLTGNHGIRNRCRSVHLQRSAGGDRPDGVV